MRAELPFRLARAAAFSAVCVLLAALAHRLAGGAGPGPLTLAVGILLVMAPAAALGGRERAYPSVMLLLGATQVGLHELFGTTFRADPELLHHGQGLSEGMGMFLAHLTATLVTGWWLARGEAALWAVLRRLFLRLLPWSLPVVHPWVRPAAPPMRRVVVRTELRHIVSRRGPPLPA